MSYFYLGAERHKPSSFPVLIRACVGDDSIKPRCKVRVFAKLGYRRKQLQEDLGNLNDAVVSHHMLTSLPPDVKTGLVDEYTDVQAKTLHTLREKLATDLQEFLALKSRRTLSQAIVQL